MTGPQSDIHNTPAVPLKAVLFGGDLPGLEMTALRTEQIAAVQGRTLIQILSIVVASIAIGLDNLSRQPVWLVGGYIAAVLAIMTLRFSVRESRKNGWIFGASGNARRELFLGTLTALVIASPLLWFAWTGDRTSADNAWIILAGMIAIYGFATLEVPLMYAAVMPAVGVISAVALALTGNLVGALAAVSFTFIGLAAILKAGHDFIRYELVGRRAEEQTETVSLLLREFEDAGSDWLWQVDANRRITKASPRFAHAAGRDTVELEGVSILQLLAGEHWSTGKFPPALHDLPTG